MKKTGSADIRKCKSCGNEMKVRSTRKTGENGNIVRYLRCPKCGATLKTFESDIDYQYIIDTLVELLDKLKIKMGE